MTKSNPKAESKRAKSISKVRNTQVQLKSETGFAKITRSVSRTQVAAKHRSPEVNGSKSPNPDFLARDKGTGPQVAGPLDGSIARIKVSNDTPCASTLRPGCKAKEADLPSARALRQTAESKNLANLTEACGFAKDPKLGTAAASSSTLIWATRFQNQARTTSHVGASMMSLAAMFSSPETSGLILACASKLSSDLWKDKPICHASSSTYTAEGLVKAPSTRT